MERRERIGGRGREEKREEERSGRREEKRKRMGERCEEGRCRWEENEREQ